MGITDLCWLTISSIHVPWCMETCRYISRDRDNVMIWKLPLLYRLFVRRTVGQRWISLAKASDATLWFFYITLHKLLKKWHIVGDLQLIYAHLASLNCLTVGMDGVDLPKGRKYFWKQSAMSPLTARQWLLGRTCAHKSPDELQRWLYNQLLRCS